jgi:uncharacterized membrane protein YbhN (UPF0104 family)
VTLSGERLRRIAGPVVSVLALAGCAWWASRQSTPAFPTGVGRFALLVAGLGAYMVATLARGWRWDHILGWLHIDHRRGDAYALTVVGYMGNTVLPARGGELLRIFLASERSRALRRESLGSIMAERILDAMALGSIFAVLTILGTAGAPTGPGAAIAAIVAVIAIAAGAFGYLRLRIAGRMQRFADRARPVTRALRPLLGFAGLGLFVLTLAVWALEGVVLFLCAKSVGLPIGVHEGLFVVVLASLSALIPAGPGYVGTYDAAALFGLHALDVHGGAAVGLLLLFRFVIFVPITAAGLILMVVRYGGLRKALRRERAAEYGAAIR